MERGRDGVGRRQVGWDRGGGGWREVEMEWGRGRSGVG